MFSTPRNSSGWATDPRRCAVPATPPADDDSFIRLFRYIGGANEAQAKIAMTTPVFSDQGGTNRQMSFVVPKKMAASGAPKAKRDDIAVQTRAAGRFAVYRFSGSWSAGRAASARRKLADPITAGNYLSVMANKGRFI